MSCSGPRSANWKSREMLITRYYLAFFKGDQAGMDREIARAPGEHAEDWMSHNQALVLARSGQMRQARTMWERAVAMAQQAGNRERAAIYEAAEAVCEAHFGNAAAAKERARAALELAKGRDVEYAAAFALALSGDSSESQRLAADLEKRFPEDTPVQFEYLPTLRALSALAHRAPSDAVERLQRGASLRFRAAGHSILCQVRRPLSCVCTRRGVPRSRAGPRGRGGIPKGSRSSRHRLRRSHRRTGALATGQSVRFIGRQDQGEKCLPGFPHALEGRRPRHPDSSSKPRRNTPSCSERDMRHPRALRVCESSRSLAEVRQPRQELLRLVEAAAQLQKRILQRFRNDARVANGGHEIGVAGPAAAGRGDGCARRCPLRPLLPCSCQG